MSQNRHRTFDFPISEPRNKNSVPNIFEVTGVYEKSKKETPINQSTSVSQGQDQGEGQKARRMTTTTTDSFRQNHLAEIIAKARSRRMSENDSPRDETDNVQEKKAEEKLQILPSKPQIMNYVSPRKEEGQQDQNGTANKQTEGHQNQNGIAYKHTEGHQNHNGTAYRQAEGYQNQNGTAHINSPTEGQAPLNRTAYVQEWREDVKLNRTANAQENGHSKPSNYAVATIDVRAKQTSNNRREIQSAREERDHLKLWSFKGHRLPIVTLRKKGADRDIGYHTDDELNGGRKFRQEPKRSHTAAVIVRKVDKRKQKKIKVTEEKLKGLSLL